MIISLCYHPDLYFSGYNLIYSAVRLFHLQLQLQHNAMITICRRYCKHIFIVLSKVEHKRHHSISSLGGGIKCD
jgi:hypothetical protein